MHSYVKRNGLGFQVSSVDITNKEIPYSLSLSPVLCSTNVGMGSSSHYDHSGPRAAVWATSSKRCDPVLYSLRGICCNAVGHNGTCCYDATVSNTTQPTTTAVWQKEKEMNTLF